MNNKTMRRFLSTTLLYWTLGCLGAQLVAAEPLFGPNLLPNAGFEEADAAGVPSGWKMGGNANKKFTLSTSPEACAGAKSLAITRVKTEEAPPASITSPLVMAEPGWYLVAFWYRYDSPQGTNPSKLLFIERKAGLKGELSPTPPLYFYFNDGPNINGQWKYTFAVIRLREGESALQLRLDANSVPDRLLLDAMQIRKLQPPSPFAGAPRPNRISDGFGLDRVKDADTATGLAWKVSEGTNVRGTKIMGQGRNSESPGLYVVNYRFKQHAPGTNAALGISLNGGGGKTLETLSASDFTTPDTYQDFPVYYYYPFGGGSFYTWDWRGKGSYSFDYLELKRLCPVSDQEAWDLLYAGVDLDKVLPPPAPGSTDQATAPVWIGRGLFTELTGIDVALREAGLSSSESFQIERNLQPEAAFPPGLKLVVLSDIPATALKPAQQYALKRFVEQGGGLIVFGGFYGYGHGGMAGSLLESILPVKVESVFDRKRISEVGEPVKRVWFGRFTGFNSLGDCSWLHEVSLKSGATVEMNAGGKPMVVTGSYGKGRVVAVLGTVLGTPKTPFWKSSAWQQELNRLTRWAAGD
jgi:hypothetical protein